MTETTVNEQTKQKPYDQFREFFLNEHRVTRDALLELGSAFTERNRATVAKLLEAIVKGTGPHFRFEEESLYPMLVPFFGKPYVRELLRAHDGAIQTARDLAKISSKEQWSDDDVARGVSGAQSILPHVSDCDGLSIMVEKMPESQIEKIISTHERAYQANLDLLAWADQVRIPPEKRAL